MSIVVNGKQYPLWSQFVEKKENWISGTLQDFGDNFDTMFGSKCMETEITDIKLLPNGDESAMFEVTGKKFSCSFDVGHGGLTEGESGWITFSGYGGHEWRIKEKKLDKKHTCKPIEEIINNENKSNN